MTFDELKATAIKWYGEIDWKVGLLHHLEIDPVTLWRWRKAGHLPAPYPMLIEAWDQLGGPPHPLPLSKSIKHRNHLKSKRRERRKKKSKQSKVYAIIRRPHLRKSTKEVLGI